MGESFDETDIMPSLTSIAEEVLAKAREIDRYLESNGLAAPSYDNDVLADLPGDLENVRYSLVNSSNELKKLAQGLAVLGKELSTGVTLLFTLTYDRMHRLRYGTWHDWVFILVG